VDALDRLLTALGWALVLTTFVYFTWRVLEALTR
jgi:hypothetical protein